VSDAAPGSNGAALASYLLFESAYTRDLMALGEKDTQARRDEVLQFFDLPARAEVAAAAAIA